MTQTIAFFGLGNMGLHMATNLVNANYRVQAYDVSENAMEQARDIGCIASEDAHDAVKDADIVISMLPSGKIVESLYIDEQALFHSLPKNTLIIDCSTVSPTTSQRLAQEAERYGIRVIDAPVSGGTAAAKAGTLSFMCGGNNEDYLRAEKILRSMGAKTFRAGNHGAGQVAKICNNMLLAIHMVGTAEAIQLGVNNGLDPATLSEIMKSSSGCNWSLEKYNPYPGVMENVPASQEYNGGFMVNLMCKDLGLAMETSSNSGSYTPMGSLAKNLYQIHRDTEEPDNGHLDFSSILRLFPNT